MRARLLFGLAVPCACLVACAGETDKQVLPPEVLGMTEATAPIYDDGQDQIYQVTKEVRLPMRAPTDEERPRGQMAPYPRPPFNLAADTRITLRFTLSNLEDQQRIVELLIDPWNEFVRYQPGVVADGDETIPNFSGIQRFYILPPKGRIEGIITPDDMVELATDLATAMALERQPPADDSAFAGPALYNRAFNVQNRSSEPDPVLAPYMPAAVSGGVVAGVTGFDLGLRSPQPVRVAVEVLIDVEDLNGNRVVPSGEDERRIGRPGTVLTPPPPPMR